LLFSAEPDDSVGGASVLCRHTFWWSSGYTKCFFTW
jgi:hypothetical protein